MGSCSERKMPVSRQKECTFSVQNQPGPMELRRGPRGDDTGARKTMVTIGPGGKIMQHVTSIPEDGKAAASLSQWGDPPGSKEWS